MQKVTNEKNPNEKKNVVPYPFFHGFYLIDCELNSLQLREVSRTGLVRNGLLRHSDSKRKEKYLNCSTLFFADLLLDCFDENDTFLIIV